MPRDDPGLPPGFAGSADRGADIPDAPEVMAESVVEAPVTPLADVLPAHAVGHAMREATRRDEFLAIIAHELRNPIAAMLGAVEQLELSRDPVANARARALLEMQLRHLARLVDDLTDATSVSRGALRLRDDVVRVADVVRMALDTALPLLDANRHTLHVEVTDAPLHVRGDAQRLVQVLVNLLHNAAKYTPPGGRVWVTAAREEDDAVIRVRDTGIGLTPEAMTQVFELFAQANAPPGAEGGLGVGLALSRHLVERQHGTLTAESDGAGRGSTFTVRLPALVALAAELQLPALPPPRPGTGSAAIAGVRRLVLIVDDYPDAAEIIALLVRALGHDAETAHDGEGALVAAAAFHPDVLLCDVALPGIDGYEVARRLRGDPRFARTTLVAVTGFGQDDDRRRAAAAGFDHHLLKPVGIGQLRALLDRLPPPALPRLGGEVPLA